MPRRSCVHLAGHVFDVVLVHGFHSGPRAQDYVGRAMLYNRARMSHIFLFALVGLGLAQTAAAPPDTEIFLARFSARGAPTVGPPVNITNNPGYDNQPSFTPDGRSILFTSIRGGGTQ